MRLLCKKSLLWSGKPENTDDLVQDMLIKLEDRTDKMHNIHNQAPWLLKSPYRQFVDSCQKQERIPEVSVFTPLRTDEKDEKATSVINNVADDINFTASRAQHRVLAHGLAHLDKGMRATLVLLKCKGYSINDPTHLPDEQPGTIKSRNHWAKN